MLGAAAAAGIMAINLVGGYSSSVAETYGPLRPVVVLTRPLVPDQLISPKVVGSSFEIRQVPARFVPAAAIEEPSLALGLEVVAPLPSGSYLTAAGGGQFFTDLSMSSMGRYRGGSAKIASI